MIRSFLRFPTARAAGLVAGLAVALTAPLAAIAAVPASAVPASAVPASAVPASAVPASAVPASAVPIAGASTLSERMTVRWGRSDRQRRTTDLHVLAWNDFHGSLEPASLNIYGTFAGGAAYLAKAVEDRQATYHDRVATVHAGDNIGAAPLVNSLFREEPATIAANLIHTDFAAVGNHEFDKGTNELKRIQNGGCPVDGCTGAPYALADGRTTDRYPGADFQYLAANVIDQASGRPLLPASGVKWLRSSDGRAVGLGFIGATLRQTPTIVTPSGVAGLSFIDEADAANTAARRLAKQGVRIPILILHQGGSQSGSVTEPNGCAGALAGSDVEAIATRLDPSIKVIITGHTHGEYRCTITTGGVTRLITSAASAGRILSDLTLTVDNRTRELVSASATNTIVANALNAPGTGVTRQDDPSKADPTVAAMVKRYVDAAAPLANRVIGTIQGDLTRTQSPQGESTLGDVIADAQLAATASASTGAAQLALMNPGGIRADLRTTDISSGGEAVGEVTYGEAFTVQPFGNSLVTKTMTGDQLRRLLEQQFAGCGGQTTRRVLQVSATLNYRSSPDAASCADKIGEISVGGAPVTSATTMRVTMNSFLATGGDGFTVFNEGTDPLGGAQDIDAFASYLASVSPTGVAVPPLTRIVAIP